MPKTRIFLAISFLILATLACNAFLPLPEPTQNVAPVLPQGNLPLTEADVPRVDVATAKAAFDGGAAIMVDVRSRSAYAESHVPKALSIPLDEFEKNIAGVNLTKEEWIITYCT